MNIKVKFAGNRMEKTQHHQPLSVLYRLGVSYEEIEMHS